MDRYVKSLWDGSSEASRKGQLIAFVNSKRLKWLAFIFNKYYPD